MFCLLISTFIYLWATYIFPGLVCLFAAAKCVDRSWEYKNRSQIHECRNWEWGRAISYLGIHKLDFRYSAGYPRVTWRNPRIGDRCRSWIWGPGYASGMARETDCKNTIFANVFPVFARWEVCKNFIMSDVCKKHVHRSSQQSKLFLKQNSVSEVISFYMFLTC